jgi:phospholipid-transporting ATPase
MLTGDKGETARMIGISCGLLTCPLEQQKAGVRLVKIDEDFELTSKMLGEFKQEQKLELMVSGRSLSQLLARSESAADLNAILKKASAVLVFRASPAQKADVVHFIRRNNVNKITVAIGDGANDVNMI